MKRNELSYVESESVNRSVVSHSLWPPWAVARQAPLSLGILQARTLEWVAIPFSRGSSQLRDRTQVSHVAGGFFTSWTTRKAPQVSKFCLFFLFFILFLRLANFKYTYFIFPDSFAPCLLSAWRLGRGERLGSSEVFPEHMHSSKHTYDLLDSA